MNTEVTLRNLPFSEDLILFARRRVSGLGACAASEVRVTLAGRGQRNGAARRVVASVEVAHPLGEHVFTGADADPYVALERALRQVQQPRPRVAA